MSLNHVLAVRITDDEWGYWQQLLEKHRVTTQQFLHGIVTDVLIDEGFDGLQCGESEGCEGARETSEARGDSAS